MIWKERLIVWAFLAFLALLVQSAAGCVHHLGVSRTWEELVPVEGTGIGDGSPPTETVLEAKVDFDGEASVLRGSIRARGAGTQEVRVQSWQETRSVPYHLGEALVLRSFLVPFYFVMLAPLWAPTIPDYGGDGRRGLWDRSRHAFGMLNPLEALPLGTSEEVSEMAGEVPERHETIVDLRGVPADLELELTSARGTTRIEVRTENGVVELPLDDALIPLFAPVLKGVLHHAESESSVDVAELNAPNLGEYLWRRGRLQPDAIGEDEVLRKNAIQVFRNYAKVGSSRKGIELHKRVFELEGLERNSAASTAPASMERLTLKSAHDAGLVDVSMQGRDLRRLSVKITHTGAETLQVVIPAGTMFDCQGAAQDMVSTVPEVLTFHGPHTLRRSLTVACANMNKDTPTEIHAFVLDELEDPRLVAIAPYLHDLSFDARQAAVWILTDNASYAQLSRYQVPSLNYS